MNKLKILQQILYFVMAFALVGYFSAGGGPEERRIIGIVLMLSGAGSLALHYLEKKGKKGKVAK